MSTGDNLDLIELRIALKEGAIELVTHILGASHNKRLSSRRTLVWGNKGSFKLEYSGKKRGLWYDFEAGEGGDLLKLIRRRITNNSFSAAVSWARNWLGWPPEGSAPDKTEKDALRRAQAELIHRSEAAKQKAEADAAREQQKKIEAAQQRWQHATPIQSGDPADLYLRSTRRIAPPDEWPSSIKFQSGNDPAVILAATNDEGAVTAVQIIRVTSAGHKRKGGRINLVKQSHGLLKGSVVRLPGPSDGPLLVAEGPETGLSVWASTGYETYVALGQSNIGSLALPINRRVVMCADDGPRSSQSRRRARRTVNKLKSGGHDVVEAMPWEIHREDNSDFNDVIISLGPEAVKARIARVLDFDRPMVTPELSIGEARARLDEHVGAFFNSVGVELQHPHIQALGVTVGVGKTEAALKHTVQALRRLREAGTREAVVIAVPEHYLSEEVASRFTAMQASDGLSVAIWRGMDAKAPGAIDDRRMCGNLEEVREAGRVYAKVSEEVCPKCSLREGCPYLAQHEQRADLWIITHQLLYHKPPKAISQHGIAALIVDESPWRAGLIGCDGQSITIPLDLLDPGVMPIPAHGGERLADIRQRLKIAASKQANGPLRRSSLGAVGFEAKTGEVGAAAEWSRKIDKGAFSDREDNVTIGSMALIWQAVAELCGGAVDLAWLTGDEHTITEKLSGWLSVGRGEKGERVLIIRGRREVHAQWRVPTLLIDASLSEELIKPFWPDVKIIGRMDVATPFMRIHQAVGKTFGKSTLAPPPQAAGKADNSGVDKERRLKNRLKVETFIATYSRHLGGKSLVISNKAIVSAMKLKRSSQTAHFNALAGRDGWGDIRTLFVVGRTQPSPAAVEAMAGALTGEAVTPIEGWYPRTDVDRLQIISGQVMTLAGETDRHPHPIAEQCRARIAEGEVMQAIGRGRGVNRQECNPLDVFVLTDVPLTIPVYSFIPDDAILKPDTETQQLAIGGIAFEDASAAFEAYPSLRRSAGAIREAQRAEREADPSNSVRNWYEYISLPKSDADPLIRVAYQRAGSKRHRATATVDTSIIKDPKSAIEALLGPLVYFEDHTTIAMVEQPQIVGLAPKRVSDLPSDEQAEVRRAMDIFRSFAELQAACDQIGANALQDQVKADSAAFMRQWQTEAIVMGWPQEGLFSAPKATEPGGLVYWLHGEEIRALGPEHAVTQSGRVFDRLAA